VCVCVCVRAHVRMRARVRMRASVRVCVRACVRARMLCITIRNAKEFRKSQMKIMAKPVLKEDSFVRLVRLQRYIVF